MPPFNPATAKPVEASTTTTSFNPATARVVTPEPDPLASIVGQPFEAPTQFVGSQATEPSNPSPLRDPVNALASGAVDATLGAVRGTQSNASKVIEEAALLPRSAEAFAARSPVGQALRSTGIEGLAQEQPESREETLEGTLAGDIAAELRRSAESIGETQNETLPRVLPVSEEFAQSTAGQIVRGIGQIGPQVALAMSGPLGAQALFGDAGNRAVDQFDDLNSKRIEQRVRELQEQGMDAELAFQQAKEEFPNTPEGRAMIYAASGTAGLLLERVGIDAALGKAFKDGGKLTWQAITKKLSAGGLGEGATEVLQTMAEQGVIELNSEIEYTEDETADLFQTFIVGAAVGSTVSGGVVAGEVVGQQPDQGPSQRTEATSNAEQPTDAPETPREAQSAPPSTVPADSPATPAIAPPTAKVAKGGGRSFVRTPSGLLQFDTEQEAESFATANPEQILPAQPASSNDYEFLDDLEQVPQGQTAFVVSDAEGNVEEIVANPDAAEQIMATMAGRGTFLWEVDPTTGAERLVGGIPRVRMQHDPLIDGEAETDQEAGQIPTISPLGNVFEGSVADLGTNYSTEARRSAERTPQEPTTASNDAGTEGFPGIPQSDPPIPLRPRVGGRVSAPQVMDSLAGILNAVGSTAPIRQGRVRGQAGSFETRPEVARIRVANDIQTATHELGHALAKQVGRAPDSPLGDKAIKGELVKLGKKLYGKVKPVNGYAREGFAELIRFSITNPDHARKTAPKASAWFGNYLEANPDAGVAVERSRTLAADWYGQGAIERAKASVVQTSAMTEALAGAKTFAKKNLTKTALIESGEPIRKLVEQARSKGANIPVEQDPFFILSARRLTHDAIASHWVEDGMTDYAGNVVGGSLKEALAPVRDKREDFLVYLWAKRAQALHNEQGRRDKRNPGLALPDANDIVAQLESPDFELAASKVYQWNDSVLEYAAQSSPDYRRLVEKIREVDPGAYIPLQREFSELDDMWTRSAKRGGGKGKGDAFFSALKGSGRRIKDPFEAMISQASHTALKAHERAMLDGIVKIARNVEGMGNLIVEVPQDQLPAVSRDVASLLSEVKERVREHGGDVKVTGNIENLAEEYITFFVPSQAPKGKDPVVPIYEDGTLTWYEVDRDLYATLKGLDTYRLPKVWDMTLGSSTRAFRMGTTGLRASFSLVTNPLRDFRTLHANARNSANTGKLFLEWMRQMGIAAADAATGGKVTGEHLQFFERMGGNMATPLGQDKSPTRRAAKRLFQGRVVRTIDPGNVFDWMRDMLQFPETAARTTEVKLLAKDLGIEIGKPMTEAQAQELLLAGKQVTTDFSAAGNLVRVFNTIIPFLNSQIQGPRAHVRAAKRDPGKFAVRGLQGTALALGLWFANKDEEWWKEMPAKEKYLYTYIPFTGPDGTEELLRLPRAFELDGVFMASTEALADAWYQKEPEKMTEWFQAAFSTTSPNLLPPLVEETAEQLANKDFFFDAPIVPRSEIDLFPEEQAGQYTSTVSTKLGEIFDVSPRRIDHAVRGIFGGVGGDLLQVFGTGAGSDRESEMADMPVIGTLFQRGGQTPRRPKSIDQLYDRLDYAEKRGRSDRMVETEEQKTQRLLLKDATKALTVLRLVRNRATGVSKRREIDALEIKIAQEANKQFDEGPDREAFKAWLEEGVLDIQ